MPHASLTPETWLSRNESIFASEIDSELVMMDESQGLYFALNPVGRAIWENLASPLRYGSLIENLVTLHDVDESTCRADVEPFLEKMIGYGLVRVTPE